jgi:protein O-GlcNAc transferase
MKRQQTRAAKKRDRTRKPSVRGQEKVEKFDTEKAFSDAVNHHQAGQLQKAEGLYKRVLDVEPTHAYSLNNLGAVFKAQGRSEEAITSCEKALSVKPDYAEAHCNLGLILFEQGRLDKAATNYGRALSIKPDYAEAHFGLAVILHQQGRLEEAVTRFDRTIAIRPGLAEAHVELGRSLYELDRLDEAAASYRRAIEFKAGHAGAHFNLGQILTDQGSLKEGINCYEEALRIDPDHSKALSSFIHQSQHICRWDGLSEPRKRMFAQINQARGESAPFPLLSICDDPEVQLLCARNFSAQFESEAAAGVVFRHHAPEHDRLRIGYVSSDFNQHPMTHLASQLFESHDRERFETYAYSIGVDDDSPVRRRLYRAFDQFHDAFDESAIDTATRIHADEIDILVDLNGHTRGARTQIMAMRPAPIQVNFLGFPGSMGAAFMDYIIVDRFLVPPGTEDRYSESCVFMPESHQVNDANRPTHSAPQTRAANGLPETGFVFCCFNQPVKITPDMFAVWMRLLDQVPGSVLWLIAFNPYVEEALRTHASMSGVNPDRLVFTPRVPAKVFLSLFTLADLFLDTFPCNAHTTASDALWGGCPVLTCAGRTFASRVAGSLLTALGLEDLIADTLEAYEAKALELASQPDALTALRRRLAALRSSSPLFDGAAFSRNLEMAFETMWALYCAGQEPECIELRSKSG